MRLKTDHQHLLPLPRERTNYSSISIMHLLLLPPRFLPLQQMNNDGTRSNSILQIDIQGHQDKMQVLFDLPLQTSP